MAGLARGGHPMNLDTRRVSPPLGEYIHQQIDFEVSDWWDGWVGNTNPVSYAALTDLRQRHVRVLAGQYGVDVEAWTRA